MADSFDALVADEIDGEYKVGFRKLALSDLPDEKVLVDVAYSTVNFKDGLSVVEHSPVRIPQKLPMVCGIDLAGTVAQSSDARWQSGDKVLVNGFGLAERHYGGYSQKARLNPDWLVRLPENLSLERSMAIGTAGYTSMLCVLALEDHGVGPSDGKILVTGASGGVGSIAVSLLASLGYEVAASTGRIADNADLLTRLGASELIAREELARDSKPMERETWAGVVDCVGGKTLATAIAQTQYGGIVTMAGLTGGTDIPTTVMPFILRGITLQGIDSVMAATAIRQRAWDRLATTLDLDKLNAIYRVEPLARVPEMARQILAGQITGRVVIDVNA